MPYGMVSFIGAGPGDPELITVKGRRLIEEADLVLYAGSLVPEAIVAYAGAGALVLDSSSMTLEDTHACLREATKAGKNAARVHTGDPSIYGAIREQALLLERDGIPYQIIPGVTAAFAAAAAGRISLTVPDCVQSLTITRMGGRTGVPEGQSVRDFAGHKNSIAVYLSATEAGRIQEELLKGGLSPATPVFVAYRLGWPDELLIWTNVADLAETVASHQLVRQTVFLVLPGEKLDTEGLARSRLYAESFFHGFRQE